MIIRRKENMGVDFKRNIIWKSYFKIALRFNLDYCAVNYHFCSAFPFLFCLTFKLSLFCVYYCLMRIAIKYALTIKSCFCAKYDSCNFIFLLLWWGWKLRLHCISWNFREIYLFWIFCADWLEYYIFPYLFFFISWVIRWLRKKVHGKDKNILSFIIKFSCSSIIFWLFLLSSLCHYYFYLYIQMIDSFIVY